MKRHSIWVFLRTASGIGIICWCVDRIQCNVIEVDWARASWSTEGDGPVTFEARWKYRWSKTWKQAQTDVERNPDGPTEFPLTSKHSLCVNAIPEPVWEL